MVNHFKEQKQHFLKRLKECEGIMEEGVKILNSIYSIEDRIFIPPYTPKHIADGIVDLRAIVSYEFCQCVTITQVPGLRSSPAVKIIVLNSPQNFSFVTQGEMERYPWGVGGEGTEYRKASRRILHSNLKIANRGA